MLNGQALIADIDAAKVEPGQVAFWFLGQLGFVFKTPQAILYLDAYLRDDPRRKIPPMLVPSEIHHAAAFLGTHDHSDHIDRKVWPDLAAAAPGAKFIVPRMHVTRLASDLSIPMERFIGLDDGLSTQIADVTITAIPSAHEFLHRDDATGAYPFLGYVLECNSVRIYHSGDTCRWEGMETRLKSMGPFDLVILPINGRDAVRLARGTIGNITWQEAVDLAGSIGTRLAVPGHWDMFAHNGADPQLFVDYMKVKYPQVNALIPTHGKRELISK